MSAKKFSRGANYSEEEKTLLLSVVHDYLWVIGNTKKDGATSKEKDRAWGMVATDYNAKSKSYRSKVSLKTCYENMKKASRKSYSGKPQAVNRPIQPRAGYSLPQVFKVGVKSNAWPKTLYLVTPGPARVHNATNSLNVLKDPDRVCEAASPKNTDEVTTVPQVVGPECVIDDSSVSLEVVTSPDWSSYSVKRSSSPPSCSVSRSPPPGEDAERRKTQQDQDHRRRKLVEQEEAEIRIQILKTELLIKKEILKQEIKKTNAMDKSV